MFAGVEGLEVLIGVGRLENLSNCSVFFVGVM